MFNFNNIKLLLFISSDINTKTIHPMKIKMTIAIIFMITTISCNYSKKSNYKERLDYYVLVSSQVKDMPLLIKDFNNKLREGREKILITSNKNDNLSEINDLQQSLVDLTDLIDKRLIVLNNLQPNKGDIGLDVFAAQYLQESKNLLVYDISGLVSNLGNKKHNTSNENRARYENFKIRNDRINKEAEKLYKFLSVYKTIYKLDEKDLEIYGL